MREPEVRKKLKAEATRVISETGFLEIEEIVEEPSSGRYIDARKPPLRPDLEIRVKTRSGKSFVLLLETKTAAPPRVVRTSLMQLADACSTRSNAYVIICAPYLSEASMEICRENAAGYIDLAGNSYLNFGNVFVKTAGYPNLYPNTRPLKTIFSPKSTRALRVLLGSPGMDWYVKDLAKEAEVSLGQASNVKKYLLDYEYAEEVLGQRKNRIRLTEPEKLLKDWARNYSYTRNELYGYYSPEDLREVEERLAGHCDNSGVDYAFTLTSADTRLTQFLRGASRVFAYMEKPVEPAASFLKLEEVDSAPIFALAISTHDSD